MYIVAIMSVVSVCLCRVCCIDAAVIVINVLSSQVVISDFYMRAEIAIKVSHLRNAVHHQ